MQRLAIFALAAGLATETLAFHSSQAVADGSVANSDTADASAACTDGVAKPWEVQATLDARLRKQIQAERRAEIEEAAQTAAAAKEEVIKAKKEAEGQAHLQVVAARAAERDLFLTQKHEREAADRVLEREQERKDEAKRQNIHKRDERQRGDEKKASLDLHATPEYQKDEMLRRKKQDKVRRNVEYKAKQDRRVAELRKHEIKEAVAELVAKKDEP
eukprot:CAMPEP_0171170262 /NCGR_PEP_ID=MMETSP0790-20130122/8625_1 /TAXON_ID=2925 /ORGANISM="Alexandrium catenella, Strain OF101" /LENGTH=216 /DNA_ID=CAMNT_0011635107 /DNA_START=68 /DNA_END=718 /DNA_ORIENTATION=-